MNDNSSVAEKTADDVPDVPRAEPDASFFAFDVAAVIPAAVETSGAIAKPAPDRRARAQIQTVRFDSRDFRASWPTAIASLEQLSDWAVLALRLGILALIQHCVRELAEQDARADLIVRLRTLTDALAHMPLET